MCLGIPMQIESLDGILARCHAGGIHRDVNLMLMEGTPLLPGDFVVVHVGYAIQKVMPADARSAWELHDAIQAQEPPGA